MQDERVKVDIPVPEPRKKQHHHHTHSTVPRGMTKKKGRRDGPQDEDRPETVMTFVDGRTTPNSNNNYNGESNPFSSVIDDSSEHFSASGRLLSTRSSSDLAGRGCSNGPVPELDHLSSSAVTGTHTNSKVAEQIAKEGQQDEENLTLLNPERHSFSLALKECQNRHCISEEDPLPEKRRRPISLDFGSQGSDASVSSPLSYIAGRSMKKSYTVSKSGTFPSPGAPIYRHSHGAAVGYYEKGWSSERVPLPVSNPGRRYGSGSKSLFVPFGNGRTLPSKWEDAEKWILSPVSGDGVGVKNQTVPSHRRRPKSKSGPLGSPAGTGSYAVASPPVLRNSVASSPLMTGALVADHGCCGHGSIGRGGGGGDGGGRSCSSATQSDHCIVRSASMHGWSELLDSSSLPSSQDENSDSTKDAFPVLPVVSTKDMATQTSPISSDHSCPREKPISFPSSPRTSKAIPEPQSHSLEFDVRDVHVDNRVTISRWSKKHIIRGMDKDSTSIIGWKKKTMDSRTSAWESTETVKCVAKLNREEAKITAWENLQKTKAEAAIRKLEMKLEKKRASSMEKILRKLKRAQRLAEETRNVVAAVPCKASQDVTTTKRAIFSHRTGQMRSLSGCFTCHAF